MKPLAIGIATQMQIYVVTHEERRMSRCRMSRLIAINRSPTAGSDRTGECVYANAPPPPPQSPPILTHASSDKGTNYMLTFMDARMEYKARSTASKRGLMGPQ